jgi:hypothetical protein
MSLMLRCRDLEDALRSVSALYGVSSRELERALPDGLARAEADPEDPIGVLAAALGAELRRTPRAPSRIHYFHGTRTHELGSFAFDGLRPLGQMLDPLWREIGELLPELSERELRSLRADLSTGAIAPHTYSARVADKGQHGPCGHLLRDALLHPQPYSSVDYLAGAEIVIDICQAIEDRAGINATARYRKATTPCVVEFSVPTTHLRQALCAVLWYLGAGLAGRRTMNANWGYGGDGTPLPAERIVSVLGLEELDSSGATS